MKSTIAFIKNHKILVAFSVFLFFYSSAFFWNIVKPYPENYNLRGDLYPADRNSIELLFDTSFINEDGERQSEQEIFDKMLSMIDGARDYILLDLFLFEAADEAHRHVADELKNALIEKKREYPDIAINFITDPYNTMYMPPNAAKEFTELQEAGINVIFTDLNRLPDPNYAYSALWRVAFRWFGRANSGWIANPIQKTPEKISIRSFLELLNFKANHRKILLTDIGGEKMGALITSWNPHDPSSAHSNIAAYIENEAWKDIYKSEKSVAEFSRAPFLEIQESYMKKDVYSSERGSDIRTRIITEEQIRRSMLDEIHNTQKGDKMRIAIFYLSDRDIIKALKSSAKRGVDIQIIMDPNKDAFGMEKNGIPNRPVASEIKNKDRTNAQIRWYDTHGEQFHTKLLLIERQRENSVMILGSANFTKRNIGSKNLETDIKITGPANAAIFEKTKTYFENLWENSGAHYTAEYEKYEDESVFKYIIYRFQEWSGMSTF